MNWKSHILVTFVIYIVLVITFQFPLPNSISALILLALASLLPDFDHPKSVIREVISILLGFFSFSAFILISELEMALRLLVGMVLGILIYVGLKSIPLRHRGRNSMHQWSICFLLTGLLFIVFVLFNINLKFLAFVFVGYSVHLLTDRNV